MSTPTPLSDALKEKHYAHGSWSQSNAAMDDMLSSHQKLEIELTAANQRAEELLTERDDAEQALSQAYYLVMGRSAEWSNCFGHEQALQDIDDAQRAFRAHIKKAQDEAEEAKEREARLVVKSLNIASRETARAEDAIAIAREAFELGDIREIYECLKDNTEKDATADALKLRDSLKSVIQRLEALEKEGKKCEGCDGRGVVGHMTQEGPDTDICPFCEGSGKESQEKEGK